MINEYGTIGSRMKPPFTTIVKYDLNEPAIKWRIGFGDDPSLVERGITGTGVTADAQQHHRHRVRAGVWRRARQPDPCLGQRHGKQLWSSRFGGNFIGSPAMYEMDGRTVLAGPRRRRRTAKWPGWRRSGRGSAGWRADGLGRVFPPVKIAPDCDRCSPHRRQRGRWIRLPAAGAHPSRVISKNATASLISADVYALDCFDRIGAFARISSRYGQRPLNKIRLPCRRIAFRMARRMPEVELRPGLPATSYRLLARCGRQREAADMSGAAD